MKRRVASGAWRVHSQFATRHSLFSVYYKSYLFLAVRHFVTLKTAIKSSPFTRTALTWFSYLCIGLYAYLINILGPIIPFLRGEMGFSYTVSSLHTSAFAVGMMIAGATGDRIGNRFGRQRALWLGMLGLAGGSLLLIIGWNPVMTILGSLFMGTVGTLVMVTINASLADQYGEQRTLAFTESNVVAGFYTVAAPLMVGMASRTLFGWRAALALAIGYAFLFYLRYQSTELATTTKPQISAGSMQSSKLPAHFWRYWLVIVSVVSVEFCIITWASTFLEVRLGLSRENAALILSIFFLAMLVGRSLGTLLLRWVAPKKLLLLTIGLCAGGFLIHWLAASPVLSISGLFLAGLGVANHFPLSLGLAVGTAPDQADTASARAVIASGSAILTLPLLLGGLADWVGLGSAYGVVLPLLVVATGLVVATK